MQRGKNQAYPDKTQEKKKREKQAYSEQAGTRDKSSLPWCWGAFLQGGGSVGAIGQSVLGGHDQ